MKNQYNTNQLFKKMAANAIWRFWRQNKRNSLARIVQRFKAAKLMSSDIKQLQFDELVIFLRGKKTIKAARDLLHRFHNYAFLVNRHASSNAMPEIDVVNIRVFLAMYMIVIFPSCVFEEMGELQTALRDSGKRLLDNFERMIQQFSERNCEFFSISANAVNSLIPLLFDYMRKFKAWKIPDEVKLTARITRALFCLHYAQETLPPPVEGVVCPLRNEMDRQIERLRSKLVHIAGHAKLLEFDQRLANGEGRENTDQALIASTRVVPTYHALNSGIYFSLSKVHNQELAHELLLDPTFQLIDYYHGDRVEFRQPTDNIYYSGVREDLLRPVPSFHPTLQALKVIKGDLMQLVCESCKQTLENILDVPHIEHRVVNNAFEWSDVIALGEAVAYIARTAQNFTRHQDSSERWAVVSNLMRNASTPSERAEAMVGMLEFLFGSIGNTSIDLANARFFLFFF